MVATPSPERFLGATQTVSGCPAFHYPEPLTRFRPVVGQSQKGACAVVCPAKSGVFSRRQTYQGKSQSPVARSAGGRETNSLKPLDSTICGMVASFQAVAQANASVAPKVSSPRGRACNWKGEGSMGRRRLADAADHSGGVGATAWGQGHAKQLERPSASRREIGGSKVGCITGPPGNQPKTRGGRMGP